MSKMLRALALAILLATPAAAQVTGPPHVFVAGTVANPDEVNLNFSTIYAAACNRGGCTMTGNLLFSADNTIDIGASGATRPRDFFLGRNAAIGGTLGVTGASTLAALSATTGTFSGALSGTTLALSNAGATAIDVDGGITAGSGNVAVIGIDGRIPAISNTYFASLSGANLTGIPETAIADGSLLARVASTETISGAYTFTADPTISDTDPLLRYIETDAAANNQRWRVIANAGTFSVQALTDDELTAGTVFAVTRSGSTPQVMTISTALAVPNTISPAALASGNTNDYSPTGLSTAFLLRLTPNAAGSNVTGLAGGVAGRELRVCNLNAGVVAITFGGEDANSTAANRFANGMTIASTECAGLIYDGTSARWRWFAASIP